MKKILVLICIFCTTSAIAQKFSYGVRGGLNLVNMSTSDYSNMLNADNRAGFFLGPMAKLSLPIVGLSVDGSVIYDQRSSEMSTTTKAYIHDGIYSSGTYTSRLLAIPINIRYGLGIGSKFNIFAYTGPQIGFNMSDNRSDWTWRTSQFSWNVGLGVTVLSHMEVKLGYNIACGKTGETTFWNTSKNVVAGSASSKYNAWQLGLGWYLNGKKVTNKKK